MCFHQLIKSFELTEEWFQEIQWQGTGAVTARFFGVGMGFKEKSCESDGDAGSGEIYHL